MLLAFACSSYGPNRCEDARAEVRVLGAAVATYEATHGRLPVKLSAMSPDIIDQASTVDPWGYPYVYVVSGPTYRIHSIGQDGVDGTSDDVSGHSSPSACKGPGCSPW
jgi:hypothetical protein